MRKLLCLLMAVLITLPGFGAFAQGLIIDTPAISKAAESVFKLEAYLSSDTPVATGTGFLAFDGRVVVTSFQLVQNANWVMATSESGKQYIAKKAVNLDLDKNIALLLLDRQAEETPLSFAEGGFVRTQPVAAVGPSLGVSNGVSAGSIVALYDKDGAPWIEYAAPLSKGSSGGVLLDGQGKVAGFTTEVYAQGGDTHLALSSEYIAGMYPWDGGTRSISLAEWNGFAKASQNGLQIAEPTGLETSIFVDGEPSSAYMRWPEADMGGSSTYAAWSGAVLTFRGDSFRQNAAYGVAEPQENKLEAVWSVPVGSTYANPALWAASQPAIVKWPREIREGMNLGAEKKSVVALKEVIYAAGDGQLHFVDLNDGLLTREPLNLGASLTGAVSADSRGIPMLALGQTGDDGQAGLCLMNLLDQTQFAFVGGKGEKAGASGTAFDGSALVDRSNDTLYISGSGALHTVQLGSAFDVEQAMLLLDPVDVSMQLKPAGGQNGAGSGSGVSMYGHYAYMSDGAGNVTCVDVNDMTPVWTFFADEKTTSALALDFDREGTLALYTGNAVEGDGETGYCTIRRLDALTGREDWNYILKVTPPSGEMGGCVASPVVGQNTIGDMVIFTVDYAQDGSVMIALDKKTGDILWRKALERPCFSSPVAVYGSSGDARIIQGDRSGRLTLLDGLTGAVMDAMELGGAVEGSPAVYNDMLVVAAGGQEDNRLYGIRIK